MGVRPWEGAATSPGAVLCWPWLGSHACGDSPAGAGWDSSTAQPSPAGPGGHAAAQPVIFKSQTLSTAVISLSPPACPGGWPGRGGPTPAAQGLPAQQSAWTGEKGAECPPCPAGSHGAWAAAAGRVWLPRLCRYLQGNEGEYISSSATPGCCRTVWLQLTNPAELIRALQMCRLLGQPHSRPEPSRGGKVHPAGRHPQPGGSKSVLWLSESRTSPQSPPVLHGVRETHPGTWSQACTTPARGKPHASRPSPCPPKGNRPVAQGSPRGTALRAPAVPWAGKGTDWACGSPALVAQDSKSQTLGSGLASTAPSPGDARSTPAHISPQGRGRQSPRCKRRTPVPLCVQPPDLGAWWGASLQQGTMQRANQPHASWCDPGKSQSMLPT